jgi:hypothetical protein
LSNTNNDDVPKVKLFSGENAIKLDGELLSNTLARKLIILLKDGPFIKNEMAKKLNVQFSLISHHLDKLIELDCVEHSEKIIAKGGIPHDAYKLKGELWVLDPANMNEERIDDNKLRRFFKDSVKFAAIGFAGVFSFLILNSTNKTKWSNAYQTQSDPTSISIIISLLVIISGLVIYIIIKKKKGGG